MKRYTDILLLATLCLLGACDATIHEYPVSGKSLVIIEPSIDRRQPLYYKEVAYDEQWNRTVSDLPRVEAQPYGVTHLADMRIILDIYEGRANTRQVGRRLLQRRTLYTDKDALPPQDTIHAYLPHGDYYVLAWADYVPQTDPADWHYLTDTLTNIRTDISTYPNNGHLRSTAAGQVEFGMDFALTREGYPVTRSDEGTSIVKESRVVPVGLSRPAGRYRVVALDYEDFLQTGGAMDGMTVKVIYRQYVSAGFNVATMEPNLFVTTYSFDVHPSEIDYEGKQDASLFGDYIFTTSDRETNVLADFYFYDAQGQEISHSKGIEIPLMRNRETVVKGYFLTCEVGSGSSVGIDENFEGEYVIEID